MRDKGALERLALNKNVSTMMYEVKEKQNKDIYFSEDANLIILDNDYINIKADLNKLDKIKAIAQEANTHERTKINKIMKVLEE